MKNGLGTPLAPGTFQPLCFLPSFTLSTFSTAAFARLLIAPLGLESAENTIFLHLPFQNLHGLLNVIAHNLHFQATKLAQRPVPLSPHPRRFYNHRQIFQNKRASHLPPTGCP